MLFYYFQLFSFLQQVNAKWEVQKVGVLKRKWIKNACYTCKTPSSFHMLLGKWKRWKNLFLSMKATDRKVMPVQFSFSFLVFSYFNSLYPLGGGIPEETFHCTVVLQQKKLTLTSTCSCLLSVVRRMRKFFIHFSMFSSKCSGKSCNIYFHNQLKILLEWALKVLVNKKKTIKYQSFWCFLMSYILGFFKCYVLCYYP